MTPLLVALGAALGAPLRYALAHRLDGIWPLGTLTANLIGSGLLGYFAAVSLRDASWALLAVGFCGALTSFSSFAVQTVDQRGGSGSTYAAVTTFGAVSLCALGFLAGSS